MYISAFHVNVFFSFQTLERECWAILNKPKPKVEPPKEDTSKQQQQQQQAPPQQPPPTSGNQNTQSTEQQQPSMEID